MYMYVHSMYVCLCADTTQWSVSIEGGGGGGTNFMSVNRHTKIHNNGDYEAANGLALQFQP